MSIFPYSVDTLPDNKNWSLKIDFMTKKKILYLGPLVHNSDVLSKVAVLLAADGTRTPVLVVHIVDVPLQVGLEVAAVATLRTFEIFNLKK